MAIQMYITGADGDWGFKDEGHPNLLPIDVEITMPLYTEYFAKHETGIDYRIKDINGVLFDDIFEEIIKVPAVAPPTEMELLQARLVESENAILMLMDMGMI